VNDVGKSTERGKKYYISDDIFSILFVKAQR